VAALEKAKLPPYLMVDFSHANSYKDYRRQPEVAANIAEQIASGNKAIMGVMIESHLVEGNQKADGKKREELVYGQSITDACINWDSTAQVLDQLSQAVAARRTRG
jgi:3-deoxy-7-phosphoheptulonate synthase